MASVTILGCGASLGVPVIGCFCSVCTSSDLKNRRRRTGLLIEHEGKNLLIDASPDIREQLLLHSISKLDGLCLTHAHFDHTGGLIDLTPLFSKFSTEKTIPCLLSTTTSSLLEIESPFLFSCVINGIGLSFRKIESSEKLILNFANFPPIHCSSHEHSDRLVTSYRFGSFAFVTDVTQWNNSITELLASAEVAFIGVGGWKKRKNSKHTSIEETLAHIEPLKNLKTIYFTHLSHYVDRNRIEYPLVSKTKLAWDGLKVEFVWRVEEEL